MTYEEKEGQYKNINTGALAFYLPWRRGIHKERYVILMIDSRDYLDISHAAHSYCNACDLPTTAIFSLIGVCKDTYFGKKQEYLKIVQLINQRFAILAKKQE